MDAGLLAFLILVGICIALWVIESDARKKGIKQGWDEASKYFNDGIVVLRQEIKAKNRCDQCGYIYSHDGKFGMACMKENCKFSTRPRVTWGHDNV